MKPTAGLTHVSDPREAPEMTSRKTSTSQSRPIARSDAVTAIAHHIADRTAFVISVPPAILASAANRLSRLRQCIWYSDNGGGLAMMLTGEGIQVARAVDMLLPGLTAAVAVVPKTVSAAKVAQALGHLAEIPADGSRDLIMLQAEDEVVIWPRLLTDALAIVDPKFALRLAASDVRRMS